jgi:pentatricopeptide repeat protein
MLSVGAWSVFNKKPSRDVVTWKAILGECIMHRHGKEALTHFELMYEEGVQPDYISFVCVLSACSHAGLVDEGMCYYALMITVYIISAELDHYTSMINLLAHAGHLQEAVNHMWLQGQTLPSACRIHGYLEIGECVT